MQLPPSVTGDGIAPAVPAAAGPAWCGPPRMSEPTGTLADRAACCCCGNAATAAVGADSNEIGSTHSVVGSGALDRSRPGIGRLYGLGAVLSLLALLKCLLYLKALGRK